MKRVYSITIVAALIILCSFSTFLAFDFKKEKNEQKVVLTEQKINEAGRVEKHENTKANAAEPPKVEVKEPEESTVKEPTEEEKRQALLKATYKQNDEGEGVKEIQKLLNKFGYNLEVDGQYGTATYNAVSDFQSKAKLKCDGSAGPATVEKLQLPPTEDMMYKKSVTVLASHTSSTTEEKFINSQSAVSKTDFYIYVDTNKLTVSIFNGSLNNWTLVKSIRCSMGKSSTPTVKGKFSIGNKGLSFTADSGVVCKYYSQFYGNYLFHSVLYDSKGNNIVDGRLGMKISHGCIRLATEDAKYIYENIPSGTTVWVK